MRGFCVDDFVVDNMEVSGWFLTLFNELLLLL